MHIYLDINSIPKTNFPVITIGTFDGIHLGHQKLIKHLLEKKSRYHGTAFLVTFEPHPQLVLNNKNRPISILTTLEEKVEILKKFSLDGVVVIPFTKALSELSGKLFIKSILIDKIGFKDVVIGYDHAFGKNRSGNAETLKKMSREFGFRVNVVEPVSLDGQIVKSTSIRSALKEGDVKKAAAFLGRPYQLTGKVSEGAGRGKRVLFPTANLEISNPKKLIPKNGVYVVEAVLDDRPLPAIANIGTRPTFDETVRTIEAHIFNFNADIYGRSLTLSLLSRIRGEEKFDSVESLINQIKKDIKIAKRYFQSIN
ncbi:riboflavin biosynthesis protein RibF [bacterium BMS3Abin05]|nr:riboflavin biosynthesis protein RibF [bacterium BMS3Abin05]GBE28147.1 riboflavin biosynthesis protein RibF [bacterium BMS3Bbin03]HDZ12249.1 bifunctional riboflavin kinase/FAD synthetase [Bacteroidota bacterium]